MDSSLHLIVNAMANSTGGGFTVARELTRHLAILRPDWTLTIVLVRGNALHENLASDAPRNCRFEWAPASAKRRIQRAWFERRELPRLARRIGVDVALQLNGMFVPGLGVPTLSHCGDPWPYLPEAWGYRTDFLLASARRAGHAHALRRSDFYGFTSHYLKELMLARHRIYPRGQQVFYNGLPGDWIARCRQALPPLDDRPMELLTVGNVSPYKGQHLIVEALPLLRQRSGLKDLRYRIVGDCSKDDRRRLETLIHDRGMKEHVIFDGRATDEQLQTYYRSARCFALLSNCESFGIPLLEAMTFGTPTVASNAAALPEICGDATEWVNRDDLAQIVEGISRVLTDTEHAQRLRIRAVQRVVGFDWRISAEAMALRLEELVKTHR